MSHLGFCVLVTIGMVGSAVLSVLLPGWWVLVPWGVTALSMFLYAARDGVI